MKKLQDLASQRDQVLGYLSHVGFGADSDPDIDRGARIRKPKRFIRQLERINTDLSRLDLEQV